MKSGVTIKGSQQTIKDLSRVRLSRSNFCDQGYYNGYFHLASGSNTKATKNHCTKLKEGNPRIW